ncbi:MAG TPA: M42 family peptidase [Chloroflexi bacterium]|nr:M42 family peptidase [Chloroflexota bacterium]
MKTNVLLRQLSDVVGISGHEAPARDLVRQIWEPLVDEIRDDKMSNLIALKKGQGMGEDASTARPKLMLAAHIDEIGLRVTGIEKGFLRITRVGGTDQRLLLGLEVTVHGQRDLPGIVATRPPHVLPQSERKKSVPWDQIFVDVGLPPDEVEQLLQVGDLISFRREAVELKNNRIAGKAMDDRASVAIVTLVLEQLANVKHAWDVYAVATVQEETGLKGAMTSAYGVAPDMAVALDVTFAKQPGLSDDEFFPLGKGPTISVGPNFHPKLVERLKEVAKAQEISYHVAPISGRSGTDAWAIQVAREGVPTALIGLPLRYMHQPVELLDVQDVERAGRWLATFVAGLEADFLDTLAWHQEPDSDAESE